MNPFSFDHSCEWAPNSIGLVRIGAIFQGWRVRQVLGVAALCMSMLGATRSASAQTTVGEPVVEDRAGRSTAPMLMRREIVEPMVPGGLQGEAERRAAEGSIMVAIQAEAGIYLNPANPRSGNFGQLFHDRANAPQLNQVLLTVSRTPIAPEGGYGVGFNFQAMYGSDARYDGILGINDDWISAHNQIAISQANVAAHLPWLTNRGVDLKIGILPGAMGIETLDPHLRPFYSLSYTANFLVPFQHVGAIATVHVGPHLDVFSQLDSGNQVSFGGGDHNGAPAGYLGMVLHDLDDGRLSIFATTRIGPELPRRLYPHADSQMRYWNDISVFYNPTKTVSLGLEANYLYDEGLRASAYAMMGFATYIANPRLSLSVRAEVYRDETGQFTALFLGNQSFIKSVAGDPAQVVTAPGATYGSWTAGASIRPAVLQKFAQVIIRPEIRYDRSLSNTRPFNDLKDRGAFMAGADLIIGF